MVTCVGPGRRVSVIPVGMISPLMCSDGQQERHLTDYLAPIGNRTEIISTELQGLQAGATVDRGSARDLAMCFEEATAGVVVFYGLARISAFPGREAVQMHVNLERWRDVSGPFVRLFEDLQRRSPLQIDDTPYDLSLIDIEHDPQDDRKH